MFLKSLSNDDKKIISGQTRIINGTPVAVEEVPSSVFKYVEQAGPNFALWSCYFLEKFIINSWPLSNFEKKVNNAHSC